MKKMVLFLVTVLGTLFFVSSGWGTPSSSQLPDAKKVVNTFSGLSVPFIENRGQIDKDVAYYAKTLGATLFVTQKGEMVYGFPDFTLVERIPGLTARPKGLLPSHTSVSSFIGSDPEKWQKTLPTFGTVSLGTISPGVAVTLKAYGGKIEKVITVAPHASPSIALTIDGASSLGLGYDGELIAHTEKGDLTFSIPIAYQEINGKKVSVLVAYMLPHSSLTYTFALGPYDPSRALIIDPLIQSTYLGGTDNDFVHALAIGADGVYVAGESFSSNFPGTTGGAQSALGEPRDAFVALLTPDLKSLIQSTYLGGDNSDQGHALAIGAEGVYVAGATNSSNFPGTTGGAQSAYGGKADAFVALLSPDLKSLTQATYLGGAETDTGNALAIGADGIYVAGYTASSNFPGTTGGAQSTLGGDYDAFVALLSPDLKSLTQATYLGGSGSYPLSFDLGNALAIGADGIYVAGYTASSNFPGTTGGAQSTLGGNDDAFVAFLALDLKSLTQSTFLGGANTDRGNALAIGADGVYVAGETSSSNFPGTTGGAQSTLGGGADAFVALLTPDLKSVHNLTVTMSGSGTGTVTAAGIDCGSDCEHKYIYGTEVVLTANADTGSVFGQWSGCNSVVDNVCTVLINGDRNVTATFYLEYTLVVTIEGTGDGSVTSAPSGINCEPTCSDTFVVGTNVRLTAKPDAGSLFSYWSGGCTGTKSTCDLVITGNKEVVAHFASSASKEYTLAVTQVHKEQGDGTVTSNDGNLNCGDICSYSYLQNAVVTLSATANADSIFIGWSPKSLNCFGTDPCTVTMDKKKSVKAVFLGPNKLKVVTTFKKGGTGTVTSSDDFINCPRDCEKLYRVGDPVTLTATPATDSSFIKWTGKSCKDELTNQCTFDMDKNSTVKAIFQKNP
jgi:hypothetical protein